MCIQLYTAHVHSDCLGLHLFYLYRWFIHFLCWVEFHGMSIHHFLFSHWLTGMWWLILCVNLAESMCNQLADKILFLMCLKAVSRGDYIQISSHGIEDCFYQCPPQIMTVRLNENAPHTPRCLNTWSPGDNALQRGPGSAICWRRCATAGAFESLRDWCLWFKIWVLLPAPATMLWFAATSPCLCGFLFL